MSSFDLVSYARERRLRVRDLHDGKPVPPVSTRAKPKYRSGRESDPAIVCRYGYVHAEPPGLGWAVFFESGRGFPSRGLDHGCNLGCEGPRFRRADAAHFGLRPFPVHRLANPVFWRAWQWPSR